MDSGLPRTRGCSSPAQCPWAAGNLGQPPELGVLGRKPQGKPPRGFRSEPQNPGSQLGGGGAPMVLYTDRELRSWDPLLWSRGEQTGRQLPSPHPEPCVLSFPLLPSSFPMCLGKKECQRHPVSQGPCPGGKGPATKSWRSTVVLAAGDPRVVQAPTLGALCPLMGLWMCPALTAAACPSSLGRQQSPPSHWCLPLAGPQRKL